MYKHFLACCFATLVGTYPAIAQVSVELDVNAITTDSTDEESDDYVTWAPSLCRARLLGTSGAGELSIVLTNDAAPTGGDVLFDKYVSPWPSTKTATQNTLALDLPRNGDWRPFVVAGKFGKPSFEDKDVVIVAHQDTATGPELGREDLMVRIRKNALSLTAGERQRLLSALAALNNMGDYTVYQQMHAVASGEAHFGPAFLAWHRAEILQFERALQAIDPSVSLPYWKFDEAAPGLFSADYLGANGSVIPSTFPVLVEVDFDTSNPLFGWQVQSEVLQRRANSRTVAPPSVQSDSATLNPPTAADQYSAFSALEGNPHGPAHVWVGGWMGNIPTAVRDPVFFLLHCNVDRLWSQWQRDRKRFDPNDLKAYSPASGARIGHNVGDTMWPWNDANTAPRPPVAPGTPIAPAAPFRLGPPAAPCPRDAVDYAGHSKPEIGWGFAYDTVPFGNGP